MYIYTYVYIYVCNNNRFFFYLQVASFPKTWGSKPTCPEKQSKEIAVKKPDKLD